MDTLTEVYDPSADPKRTDERTVRATVPAKVGGAQVIAQGRFQPGGSGCYAGVEVLCMWGPDSVTDEAHAYSTHTLVLRVENGVEGPHYLISGHYDMSFAVAMADLAGR